MSAHIGTYICATFEEEVATLFAPTSGQHEPPGIPTHFPEADFGPPSRGLLAWRRPQIASDSPGVRFGLAHFMASTWVPR